MKEIILSIAGIPLSIKHKDGFLLPPLFRKFKINNGKTKTRKWSLESVGIGSIFSPQNRRLAASKIQSLKKRFISYDESQVNWKQRQRKLSAVLSHSPDVFANLSFYFDDPVEINYKEKKISHFCQKEIERLEDFDYRLVTFAYSQVLASLRGFLLHCACVVKDGNAFLFFAQSGGGKSTVARLSKQYIVLGDDVIAVRKAGKNFIAFPTPWMQKKIKGDAPRSKAMIKAVFFLKKSNKIYFKPVKPQEALVNLLSRYIHFFLYLDKDMAQRLFFTAVDFFKTVPAYEMYFIKDRNFWPILERIIK